MEGCWWVVVEKSNDRTWLVWAKVEAHAKQQAYDRQGPSIRGRMPIQEWFDSCDAAQLDARMVEKLKLGEVWLPESNFYAVAVEKEPTRVYAAAYPEAAIEKHEEAGFEIDGKGLKVYRLHAGELVLEQMEGA